MKKLLSGNLISRVKAMQKKDIIYNKLIQLLQDLTLESNFFEVLYLELMDQNNPLFDELSKFEEQISAERNNISVLRENGLLPEDLTNLASLLENFTLNFPQYEHSHRAEILSLINLISGILATYDGQIPDLAEDYPTNTFCFIPVSANINMKYACYSWQDIEQYSNSIVFLDYTIGAINFSQLTERLLLDLTFHIGNLTDDLTGRYVMISSTLANKPSQATAIVKLHLVKSGQYFHKLYNFKLVNSLNNNRKIVNTRQYQQFNETFTIMSEANYYKDILDVFFRLYHVIENFMYKFPVVKLERVHSDAVFSIRDFQLLYDSIKKDEFSILKKLMQAVFAQTHSNGVTFHDYIIAEFRKFRDEDTIDELKINKLFSLLRIADSETVSEFDRIYKMNDSMQTASFYAQFVYALRNSIVHNRETEFHLTHATLLEHQKIGNIVQILMEKFVIPTLHEVIYYLVLEENELVWYKESKINLWSEV